MNFYLILQILILIIAVIIGLRNAWLGMSRAGMWTFPKKRHQILGSLFFLLVTSNLIFALSLSSLWRINRIRIPGYLGLSWLIFILSLFGTILGIIRSRKKRIITRYQTIETSILSLHPWPLILAVGLIFAQIFNLLNRLLFPLR